MGSKKQALPNLLGDSRRFSLKKFPYLLPGNILSAFCDTLSQQSQVGCLAVLSSLPSESVVM